MYFVPLGKLSYIIGRFYAAAAFSFSFPSSNLLSKLSELLRRSGDASFDSPVIESPAKEEEPGRKNTMDS